MTDQKGTPPPRQLGPRMVHLTDQALAAVPHPGTMSTPAVIAAIGLSPADSQAVWRALNWLARQGLVERVRMPESRSVYWRRTDPAPTWDLEGLLQDSGDTSDG